MILADTSIWIEHFRSGHASFAEQLLEGKVLMHPWVLGELACGNLKEHESVMADLRTLPSVTSARDAEVFAFIEGRRLWGAGLGWLDMHLLASSILSRCAFWTLDKRLERTAAKMGLSTM